MSKTKFLVVVLGLGLALPGCSHSPKASRNERAYYKYLKKTDASRGVRQKQITKHERTTMPSLRPAPTPRPEEEGPQAVPENQ
jgi:hypothetical protein